MSLPNDTNATDEDDDPQYEEPPPLRIFRLALFSLIILASLIGNSVVCKAVWSMPSRKPFSYHLVANMAFAEIISSLCLPVIMVFSFEDGHEIEIVHDINCIVNPIQVLSMMVVTYSLAALALHRYRVLINPVARTLSIKLKLATFFCLWLLPTVVCIPLFLSFTFENGHCRLYHGSSVGSTLTYELVRFVLNFVLPSLVMVASYAAVAWNLRQRIGRKAAEARGSIIPSSHTAEVDIDEPVELHALKNNKEGEEEQQQACQTAPRVLVAVDNCRCVKKENSTDAEQDLLKMIFVIILIFVFCYFPYQVVFLWEILAGISDWQFRHHNLMRIYLFILSCVPSALHPVCYGTMNSFYAKAFSKIFLCKP